MQPVLLKITFLLLKGKDLQLAQPMEVKINLLCLFFIAIPHKSLMIIALAPKEGFPNFNFVSYALRVCIVIQQISDRRYLTDLHKS